MKHDEIQAMLLQAGCTVADIRSLHTDYQCPPSSWVFRDFATALRQFQEAFNVTRWTGASNCCSNFALNAWTFARDLHHNSPRAREDSQIAMGCFAYTPDTGFDDHMLNFFVTLDDGKPRLQFMEPQTRLRVELSESELKSCEFAWY
jgi:hypothetical protein